MQIPLQDSAPHTPSRTAPAIICKSILDFLSLKTTDGDFCLIRQLQNIRRHSHDFPHGNQRPPDRTAKLIGWQNLFRSAIDMEASITPFFV